MRRKKWLRSLIKIIKNNFYAKITHNILILILTIFTNSWNFVFWEKIWEQIQIEIYYYYKSITSFKKNNTNISAVIKDYDATQKSIIITGKKSWESVVYIKNWKWIARIVQDDPKADTWNKPYNSKVYAKNENWNEVMKSFWKPEWTSTFFPDGWNEKKILEEVEYAVKNNSGKYPGWTVDEHFWISKSWLQINFYLKPDWSIRSYFPKIIDND